MRRVSTRNAAFQQWQALLTNRTKRQRAGEFLVQGVRPITLAREHGWEIRTLLHAGGARSRWAQELLGAYDGVELAPELLAELGGKDTQELIAVVGLRPDRLDRIRPDRPDRPDQPDRSGGIRADGIDGIRPDRPDGIPSDRPDRSDGIDGIRPDRPDQPDRSGGIRADGIGPDGIRSEQVGGIRPGSEALLVVVFDRPTTPGNIGTLVRSADAFGAHGVVVTGHAADPYDPRAVRASTGSLFAVPVVRVPSHREVLDGVGGQLVATDEHGDVELARHDLTGPTVLLVGNETSGLSAAWREAADVTVRIPIGGAASSLNAAAAGTVVLYEAARQRSSRG